MTIRVAIIGFGKIARAEHVPAIAADPDFELVAVVAPNGAQGAGVPVFASLAAMLAAMPDGVDAVSLCTPPRVRRAIAAEAIAAGLAVLLEKPPAATFGELQDLEARARAAGTCLFAAWHSQHAPAVAPAAAALAGETITRLAITWHEDVTRWHPGQDWIWEPEGFGVFDAGINALSIASAILREPLFVTGAAFTIEPGRQAPIAAALTFAGERRTATFDWRATDEEVREIHVATAAGRRIAIRDGGASLSLDGAEQPLGPFAEYPALYRHFARLVAERSVAVDAAPLRIIADAALIARRLSTASRA
ncbi:Gfo/Idh/MocA family protein [Erythrobacter sp. WG]|uniref:Gfo/Idh/MocA family protein n=1 Tax=Erythrobacter sp. WG TaxID=2985510 RepID=UPI0022704BAF|nr:Gfo/Idh/MocA family oxidoreductase [Erythrobacter sp. WG]MCX9147927.1 Gfo/Idh/MocA family oxidoreductase [Erythrobacter sp. WG]